MGSSLREFQLQVLPVTRGFCELHASNNHTLVPALRVRVLHGTRSALCALPARINIPAQNFDWL